MGQGLEQYLHWEQSQTVCTVALLVVVWVQEPVHPDPPNLVQTLLLLQPNEMKKLHNQGGQKIMLQAK